MGYSNSVLYRNKLLIEESKQHLQDDLLFIGELLRIVVRKNPIRIKILSLGVAITDLFPTLSEKEKVQVLGEMLREELNLTKGLEEYQ